MVLRPMGTYILTTSALYTQTRTTHHLTEMTKYSATSTSLTALSEADLTTSTGLESEAALHSESGLELQSESIALDDSAEREFAKALQENALAEEYSSEAEALHEQSAEEALESQSSLTEAGELEVRSKELQMKSEEHFSSAALKEEKAMALLDEASNAEAIAEEAEVKAGEYEAAFVEKEAESLRDGEAFAETEAGAVEDAEAVAACTVIPFLNVICDALGAITEAGYQTIAAFEGAKSAMESISAASAQGKERSELALAVEKHAEAAEDTAVAEEYQTRADEESAKAETELGDSDMAELDGKEAQVVGEEMKEDSERKEAMAVLDDEKATEYYAKAVEDESIAAEEETSAIAAQSESEELLSQSTEEEFESQSERLNAASKEGEAEKMMEQSIRHGIRAFGMVIHAVLTAGLVVYVVVMRGLVKVLIPNAFGLWKEEKILSLADIGERICGYLLHFGVVGGTLMAMSNQFLHFDDAITRSRWTTLLYLALVAGGIEAVFVHSSSVVCCCLLRGADARTITMTTAATFLSRVVHLVPFVLMECLILLTLFGPRVFNLTCFSGVSLLWAWCPLLLLVAIHIWYFELRSIHTSLKKNQGKLYTKKSVDGWEESYFCQKQNTERQKVLTISNVDQEYGSLEEITILVNLNENDDIKSELSAPSSYDQPSKCDTKSTDGCLDWCRKSFRLYCEGLSLMSDLLVISQMAMLLWHCMPILRVLLPLAKTSLAILSSWVSAPIMIAVLVAAVMIVHLCFVR